MRSSLLFAIALVLSGCAASGLTPVAQPTLAGIVQYSPPTAAKLAPACAVATPDADDTNACDLYRINSFVCQQNLIALAGEIDGVAMMVPIPQVQAAALVNGTVVAPVLSATELKVCTAGGYIVAAPTKVVAPLPPTSIVPAK